MRTKIGNIGSCPPAVREFCHERTCQIRACQLRTCLPVDVSRYERACDEAIAMCDGNMRSTIKALIMANEYLEAGIAGTAGGDLAPRQ